MLDDRYEVLEEIGVGRLGRVVRAMDRPANRPVALRIIEEPNPNRASALLTAIRHAKLIHHRNVVRILDAEEGEGQVWFAMELLQGRSLSRALDEDGPFDAARLVKVALELCTGLDAAHSTGLIHRDLKPGNVMLCDGGLKILDTGLAYACSKPPTVPYASPEARHEYPLDERADLYSLGVLLVELATGSHYALDSSDAPLALPSQVPAPLAAVILRLLHQDSAARFRNARVAAEALRSALPAPEPAPPPRSRAKRRAAYGLGAVLAVLGVAGLWALTRGHGGALPSFFAGCNH